MVRGKWWRKKTATAATWSYNFYWHPECWLKEALAYIEQHPYVPTGRPRLVLDEDARAERLRLLRERARIVYMLRELMISNNDESVESILIRLEQLRAYIEPLGGVPKSWDKPLFKE